jgi:hypothetical protein
MVSTNIIKLLMSHTGRGWGDGRLRLKRDGTRAETRFCLSAKRTSSLVEGGVQSTTGSRAVRISGNNAGYTKFRGSVKGTGYPIHSPVSPSLPLPCVITFQLHSNYCSQTELFFLTSDLLVAHESLIS